MLNVHYQVTAPGAPADKLAGARYLDKRRFNLVLARFFQILTAFDCGSARIVRLVIKCLLPTRLQY